jgi:hypothetical protein
MILHRATRHDRTDIACSDDPARLCGVFPIFPVGIIFNGLNGHDPGHAVASDDLNRGAGERHKRIHEIGMRHPPKPGMHSTLGSTDDQSQVIHFEPVAY